jgi:hypothetical protein
MLGYGDMERLREREREEIIYFSNHIFKKPQ